GLTKIARRVHRFTAILKAGLQRLGFVIDNERFFDTITGRTAPRTPGILARARDAGMNFRILGDRCLGISLDQTTTRAHVEAIWRAFSDGEPRFTVAEIERDVAD